MKTNIFKTILPAIAIVLAMGLSFAVESTRVVQTGYFDDPLIAGIQEELTDCQKDNPEDLCKTASGFQLYDTADLDNIPNNELKRVNQ
ncbi:MAG: hypothetical protein B7Z06_00240 [Flavobacteriales bacterium 32-35-8]|nr:MAG: hypothetical protein B7Z06_00240 [Flavobacteriales bacterium 32-35-8]